MHWLATLGSPTLALALLAFLIPLPFPQPRTAPRTDTRAWAHLLDGFSSRGVLLRTSHPRCSERNLDGLYVRGRREVVVCARGDRSLTLRHEGWHLVQSLCLMGTPWPPAANPEARLSRTDRRELQLLVSPEQRQREAEARLMAQLAPADYLHAMDQACAGRLPLGQPGEPSSARPDWPAEICITTGMRTTLDLNDDLLAEAKALAAREHLSLTRLIEQGLALRLRQGTGQRSPIGRRSLPVHDGRGGLRAAVADPCSNRSLLEAADGLPEP